MFNSLNIYVNGYVYVSMEGVRKHRLDLRTISHITVCATTPLTKAVLISWGNTYRLCQLQYILYYYIQCRHTISTLPVLMDCLCTIIRDAYIAWCRLWYYNIIQNTKITLYMATRWIKNIQNVHFPFYSDSRLGHD